MAKRKQLTRASLAVPIEYVLVSNEHLPEGDPLRLARQISIAVPRRLTDPITDTDMRTILSELPALNRANWSAIMDARERYAQIKFAQQRGFKSADLAAHVEKIGKQFQNLAQFLESLAEPMADHAGGNLNSVAWDRIASALPAAAPFDVPVDQAALTALLTNVAARCCRVVEDINANPEHATAEHPLGTHAFRSLCNDLAAVALVARIKVTAAASDATALRPSPFHKFVFLILTTLPPEFRDYAQTAERCSLSKIDSRFVTAVRNWLGDWRRGKT